MSFTANVEKTTTSWSLQMTVTVSLQAHEHNAHGAVVVNWGLDSFLVLHVPKTKDIFMSSPCDMCFVCLCVQLLQTDCPTGDK